MARSWLAMMGVLLAGCGPAPLEGIWEGPLDCDGRRWEVSLDLVPTQDGSYAGMGSQMRETVDPATERIDETVVTFTVDVTLGADDTVTTRFACRTEVTTRYLDDRSAPTVLAEGCAPARYRGYTLSWDGDDRLTMRGPDGCQGSLALLR